MTDKIQAIIKKRYPDHNSNQCYLLALLFLAFDSTTFNNRNTFEWFMQLLNNPPTRLKFTEYETQWWCMITGMPIINKYYRTKKHLNAKQIRKLFREITKILNAQHETNT